MMIGEEEDVKRLFDYINLLNPTIEFTYEVSKDSVDFLDLTIHLNPFDKKLDFFCAQCATDSARFVATPM